MGTAIALLSRGNDVKLDAGQSRTVAWGRRPEAAALVAQLTDPRRGWDAIAVGEYERALTGVSTGRRRIRRTSTWR